MDGIDTQKLVRTMCSATQDVFEMMLAQPVEAGEPYEEQGSSKSFDGIIALIGLAGSWVGAGRICCSSTLACQLSGAMLGAEFGGVNEEVLDAMAELTNMIIGNVKSALEEDFGPMGLSIPTVIFGRNYQARSLGVNEWTVVPFQCGGESLEVKLCLKPSSEVGITKPDMAVHNALSNLLG